MRVRIETDDSLSDDEIVIRCNKLSDTIKKMEEIVRHENLLRQNLSFYKDSEEFFFPVFDVLFFETQDDSVYAHTANDAYKIRQKLSELCTILPNEFVRISKSTVLNTAHLMSIDKNITSSSLVRFKGSHKKVYVSRLYYKSLRQRLKLY